MRFTCPCCGYKTLTDNHLACQVCQWKDDPYQFMDPDFADGMNVMSLREAQHNFKASRKTVVGFQKDKNWCAFAAPTPLATAASMQIKYFDACRL